MDAADPHGMRLLPYLVVPALICLSAELIKPAVKGTTGILESILKYGYVYHSPYPALQDNQIIKRSGIKRVTVLSSCASIAEAGKDKVFDEQDWNEQSIVDVNTLGVNTPGSTKYRASKTLAEKGASLSERSSR